MIFINYIQMILNLSVTILCQNQKTVVLKDLRLELIKELMVDELVTIAQHFDVESEKSKLIEKIQRFVQTSPEQVAKSSHPFFGALTAEQRGVQMWKHLDHHVRQFGG